MLSEELRIKDARWTRIPPAERPHYPPTDRLAILALKSARGWNKQQTANVFFVTPATISSWMQRVDEDGPDALLQLSRAGQPLPRLDPSARPAASRPSAPPWARCVISQMLARAGLQSRCQHGSAGSSRSRLPSLTRSPPARARGAESVNKPATQTAEPHPPTR